MTVALILFLSLASLGSLAHGAPAAAQFTHPGIAHTRGSLDFVKEKIAAGEQPWATQWKELKASRYASLRWQPRPRSHVERGPSNRPDIGGTDFLRDGDAAYTHALHWALSGEETHARKAAAPSRGAR